MLLTALSRLLLARRAARLFAVLATFAAVFATREAEAAVPMCSNDARTVIAPPIGTPNRGLVLEAPKHCPHLPTSIRSLPPEPGTPTAATPDAPLRAMPVTFSGLGEPSRTLASFDRDVEAPRPGMVNPLYRPPRL